jgi:hypothetical protein
MRNLIVTALILILPGCKSGSTATNPVATNHSNLCGISSIGPSQDPARNRADGEWYRILYFQQRYLLKEGVTGRALEFSHLVWVLHKSLNICKVSERELLSLTGPPDYKLSNHSSIVVYIFLYDYATKSRDMAAILRINRDGFLDSVGWNFTSALKTDSWPKFTQPGFEVPTKAATTREGSK